MGRAVFLLTIDCRFPPAAPVRGSRKRIYTYRPEPGRRLEKIRNLKIPDCSL